MTCSLQIYIGKKTLKTCYLVANLSTLFRSISRPRKFFSFLVFWYLSDLELPQCWLARDNKFSYSFAYNLLFWSHAGNQILVAYTPKLANTTSLATRPQSSLKCSLRFCSLCVEYWPAEMRANSFVCLTNSTYYYYLHEHKTRMLACRERPIERVMLLPLVCAPIWLAISGMVRQYNVVVCLLPVCEARENQTLSNNKYQTVRATARTHFSL